LPGGQRQADRVDGGCGAGAAARGATGGASRCSGTARSAHHAGDVRILVGAADVVLCAGLLDVQDRHAQVAIVGQRCRDQLRQARIAEELLPAQLGGRRSRRRGRVGPVGRHRRGGPLVGGHHGTRRQRGGGRQQGNAQMHDLLHARSPAWAPAGTCLSCSCEYMRRCRSLPLKNLRTTTKNTGTISTARLVAVIMPPITPVPIARWPAEPAPVATVSGSTPRMNAIEVMMIGRKRRWQASSAASTRLLPCACRSFAYSMISTAFLAERPMIVIRPTLKYTSLGKPRKLAPSNAPMMPNGTTRMT